MPVHSADRDQVLAFRLNSHNLAAKLTPGSILLATGACGVQNTPPGSAALALNARIENLIPNELDNELVHTKRLLQAWSLRASPHVFPTADVAVFTVGLLPTDEESIRSFIYGVEPALEKIGISATEVLELATAGLLEKLDGRSLTKDDLGIELARWALPRLTAQQRVPWQSPSWYAPGQTLGESVIRFALPLVALRESCCHADRRGNKAYLVRTDQWLLVHHQPILKTIDFGKRRVESHPMDLSGLGRSLPTSSSRQGSRDLRSDDALGKALPDVNPDEPRAELVRRYLHCYGPSTAHHFAQWAGVYAVQAARAWGLVERELVEINLQGQKTWLLLRDLGDLASPRRSNGVRFLPPHDPFPELRDRETLLPDPTLHRHVWRHAGNPGVVLAGGQFIGTWRAEKKSKRLKVIVEQFGSLSANLRSQLQAEAATLAPFKGCTSVEIAFARLS